MNRPYTAQSPYALTPTERTRGPRARSRYDRDRGRYGDPDGYGADLDTDVYPRDHRDGDFGGDHDADYHEDYDADYEDYLDEAHIDRRWMWIAGTAGAVLFIAVIMASMILGGGDSGSVSATVASDNPQDTTATTSAPAPSTTPRIAAPAPPLQPSLPAETVTTITPTPSAQAPAPAPGAPLLPAPQAAPPPPSAAPGTVTYRITGTKGLLDLVTVIYTDAQGALQTDVNVALPWSKTITLDPGVTLSSVTGTSVTGQLNCEVLDGNGAVIAAQNGNSIITNCTR
ncbi:hypothetical protein GR927_21380 [Mycolicibacterium sp. 3033]|nr:hypothetical protein [Mycolicibacterium aurantiacum]